MKTSLKLYEIQKIVMNSVVNSIGNTSRDSTSDQLLHIVCEKPPLSISQRIGIYQEAFRIRMLESLRDDFSRIEERMGAEEFDRLALLFIAQCPSTYASLAEVSQRFPDFLKATSEELYELASLDWLEILADTTSGFDSKKIATFQEVESGVDFRLAQNPALFVFRGQKKNWIVYRGSQEVFVKEMEPVELEVLEILKKPRTVDELSVELSDHLAKIEVKFEKVQTMIALWIENEIIFCERIGHV